jgi:hypothetical protein
MGYRAHVNSKRILGYCEGVFNNCSQDLADFQYDLQNEMNETEKEEYLFDYPFCIDNEFGDLRETWEIEREWLESAVKYIKENKDPEDETFYGYTYKNIIGIFQYWLDESKEKDNFSDPSFVYLTWF